MAPIPTSVTMKQYISTNQTKPCSVKYCDKYRAGISKFCSEHQRRKWRYGDPLARRIVPKEMEVQRSKCRHLVQYNSDHPAIKQGVEYFQNWLENSTNDIPGITGTEHFRRMHEEGVTGEDLLIETATVYAFRSDNPDVLPDHHADPLMMAIGLAVLGLRKVDESDPNHCEYVSELRIKPSIRRETGRIIWRDVGLLLIHIAKAIEENARSKDISDKLAVQLANGLN